MKKFEILCVTMNQKDFSKIEEMNIHSDVVFANQTIETKYEEKAFDKSHLARMISTQTRGVGVNRNFSLSYADAEICLFADDDVCYVDNLEEIVLREFEDHPDADIIIFNFNSDSEIRKQINYTKSRYHGRFERMPWGAIRIAFKLDVVRSKNIWFTSLFGGGCRFPSGEDSMWLLEAKRKGLNFFISKEIIGSVSFESSTWFTGYNEKLFFGKGAYCAAVHPKWTGIWRMYYALRLGENAEMSFLKRLKIMKEGSKGYKLGLGYDAYMKIWGGR